MWNRRDLKKRAKANFKRNYWNCVLVALVMAITVMATASGNRVEMEDGTKLAVKVSSGASAIALLLHAFVANPFGLGGKKFFAGNAVQNAQLNDLLGGFTGNYIRNVLALMLRDIFIVLWGFLFVIPGVIKTYSYMMVPYILADNAEIGPKEAIDLSRKMMHGNKWKAFMLDLSFIGWFLLNVLTLGILGIFYVNPYLDAAHAELYQALREA